MDRDLPQRLGPGILVIALTLCVLCAISFGLRTFWALPVVIQDTGIRFLIGDSWYHVRLVENLAAHFPFWNSFDPYAVYPGGQNVPVAPLVPWVLAGASYLAGWGQPGQRTIELICAFYPAVLGCLTVIPVYLLGRRLLDRTTGLLAAGLIALSPGQFLSRSLLGYTDHHVAEVFLGTLFVLACVAALGVIRDADTRASTPLRKLAVPVVARGTLAGLVLGLYLLTWLGGVFLVVIFTVWLGAQVLLNHMARRPVGLLLALAVPVFLISGLLVGAWNTELLARQWDLLALGAGSAVSVLLVGMSVLMMRWRVPRFAFPIVVVGTAAVVAVIAVLSGGLKGPLFDEIGRLGWSRAGGIIPEAEPLLIVNGAWSFSRAWSQFTTAFVLSLPGLTILIYRGIRHGDSRHLLVGLWSIAMLGAALAQNRFAYYYAVNAALLSAYTAALVLAWLPVLLSHVRHRREQVSGDLARGGASSLRQRSAGLETPRESGPAGKLRHQVLGGVAGFLVLFYPNIEPAVRNARRVYVPPEDWIAAMQWMSAHTPEPFGSPNAYYDRYETPPNGSAYAYPDSAYGVMSSWSYGYWILRMAHRLPNANPGQHGASDAARFFTAQDESSAIAILDHLGSRYVVVDGSMPYMETTPGGPMAGRFRSLAHWAGLPWSYFCEEWRVRDRSGQLQKTTVYYPAYYQTLLARLYVFRGRPVEPTECFVMSFREFIDERGRTRKELTAAKRFAGFAAAQKYYETQPAATTRIVGTDPYESCVPLEPGIGTLRLVYQSPTLRQELRGEPAACVEIYEYPENQSTTQPE